MGCIIVFMRSRLPYNKKLTSRARELRKSSTLSEVLLWNQLKKKKLNGLQFYRQFPIHNYIVDFYCKELKLAVEIDGSIHQIKKKEDLFRQKELESFGISFLRFQAAEVEKDIEGAVTRIKTFLRNSLLEGGAEVLRGGGCCKNTSIPSPTE